MSRKVRGDCRRLLGKFTKSEDVRNELPNFKTKEKESNPSEHILIKDTDNKSKTRGAPKTKVSGEVINTPPQNQISRIKGRQIRAPGSFSDIQNKVIGSLRQEDARNSLFNFSRLKTPKPKASKRLSLKKKQSKVTKHLVTASETPLPQVLPSSVKLLPSPPPPRPPSPLIPVETRETVPSIPSTSEILDNGEGRPSLRTLIHHPPKGPAAEGVRVADGVYVLNPQTLVPRVAVGYIIMDPNTVVERQEKATCTSVYTVLSGKPTFVIANLDVCDTAMPGSLFTNVPGSILQLRANQDRAIISFSTVVANKP